MEVNELLNIDYKIFRYFNNFAGNSEVLDSIFILLAEFVVFLLIAGLALFILLKKEQSREVAALKGIVSAAVGRLIFDTIIRVLFFRQRPFLTGVVTQLVYHDPSEASFPSGHATFMFAMAFSVFFTNKKWGAVYLFLALISSISRVIVGIHFPMDIGVGIVLGFLSAILTEWFFKIYVRGRSKRK